MDIDIRKIRKSLKMNQKEFGILLGYSSNSESARQSIHWIEKGVNKLPASKRKIIELLIQNKQIKEEIEETT